MSHNIDLPTHRYCYVHAGSVIHRARGVVPCVWFAVSVTPNRLLSCHILLECGAVIVDVPLHRLQATPGRYHNRSPQQMAQWDCYGWHAEVYEPRYLTGLDATILDEHHKPTTETCSPRFAVDFMNNGYSDEPAQHKLLFVAESHRDGAFVWYPQDRFVFRDSSFTVDGNLPHIVRQTDVYSCE